MTTKTVLLTSGTTWTVPSDYAAGTNASVTTVAGGGGARRGTDGSGSSGGGIGHGGKKHLTYKKKRLVYDTIEQVKEFIEQVQDEAKQELETLPDKVRVTNGKPKLSVKAPVVKVETNDTEVKRLVEMVNRQMQADYDRTVSILMKLIAQQLAEDDDLEVLLLTL